MRKKVEKTMEYKVKKIHRIIIKRMANATILVAVSLFVRPPPEGVKKKSNRFEDPYWPDEAGRGFLVGRIIVIKKTLNSKEEKNDNKRTG